MSLIDPSLSPLAGVICDAEHLFDATQDPDRPVNDEYFRERFEFVADVIRDLTGYKEG